MSTVAARTNAIKALSDLAIRECGGARIPLALLEVARKMRTGEIQESLYDQRHYSVTRACGTVCCIWGWLDIELRVSALEEIFIQTSSAVRKGLRNLFQSHPLDWKDPTTTEAADAIERYVLNGSETPWEPPFDGGTQ